MQVVGAVNLKAQRYKLNASSSTIYADKRS